MSFFLMQELLLSLKFAVKSLLANFGRTLLTLSGVIIGTLAIMVIASAGDSVKGYVLGQIEAFGNDTIQVEVKVPSASRNSSGNAEGIAQGIQVTTLTRDDAKAIGKLPNVSAWYAGITDQALSSYRETNKRVLIFGASASAPAVDRNIKLEEGTFYSESDDAGLAPVVVLGHGVKESFFGSERAVGKTIRIKDQNFRVVGVIAPRGTTGFVSFDDFAYMPLGTVQKKLLGVDFVQFITVKTESEAKIEGTALDIEALLRDRHDIKKNEGEDFSVTTIKEAQDIVGSVFNAIQILLIALASISLLVGGVGILNVMFVSVAERTSEIGLRKAVGARPKDILRQFLVEALIVALSGGVLGILLAFGVLFLVFHALAVLGFSLTFSFSLFNFFLALGFCFATGILFGTYPAWKASQVDPIRAIREG